jgi:hypothetical protein
MCYSWETLIPLVSFPVVLGERIIVSNKLGEIRHHVAFVWNGWVRNYTKAVKTPNFWSEIEPSNCRARRKITLARLASHASGNRVRILGCVTNERLPRIGQTWINKSNMWLYSQEFPKCPRSVSSHAWAARMICMRAGKLEARVHPLRCIL